METLTRPTDRLLATKFFIPVASQPLVARDRLSGLLNDALHRRLTLVCAPAGFGKTTLIAQWVGSLPSPPEGPFVAWITLDEDDDNLARFAEYTVTALSRAFPSVGTEALEYLNTRDDPAMHAVQTSLINSLAQSEAQYLIVLDDYHHMTDPDIHRSLTFLLDHLPPNAHVIVSSRLDPPLQLARLRARGWLLDVRTDDLRCTHEEGTRFLKYTAGVDLTDHDSLQVVDRTEGWLVGMQLLGHYLRGQSDPSELLEQLSGTQEYILEYLTEEVLKGQPDQVQTFLLQTSILDELSPSLCDAVMAYDPAGAQPETGHGSQAMLRYLEQANLFLVPLDHQRRWYRYHHLFADALRYQLERRFGPYSPEAGPGENDLLAAPIDAPSVPTLHRRASEWYRENGYGAEAIAHALLAHDWSPAVELIQEQLSALTIRMPADMATLQRWFSRLPRAVLRAQPQLCIAYVNALFWTGQTHKIPLWLDAAEAALRDSPSDATPADPERERMLGDITAKRAFFVAAYEENGERALALCDQARSGLTGEDHNELSIISWASQIANLSLGRAVDATASALERVDHTRRAGLVYLHIPALADAGVLLQLQGKLGEAESLFTQAIDVGNPQDRIIHSSAALAYLYQADLLREWNRLDEALATARKGMEIAGEVWSPMLPLLGVYHVLTRLHLSRGETDEALSALDGPLSFRDTGRSSALVGPDARAEAGSEVRFRYMHPWCADAERARLWLMRGDVDRAERWARQLERQRQADLATHGRPYPSPYRRDCEDVARARIALARSDPDEALVLLEPVAVSAQEGGRLSQTIEIRLLQALACEMRGEHDKEKNALTILAGAVQLGAAEGFIRTFVDEGAPVASLLSDLQARERRVRNPAPDAGYLSYIDRLLAAFEGTGPSAVASEDELMPVQARRRTEGEYVQYGEFLVEPLSQRELEVLRLLAKGSSNAEIAKDLFIAVNTVKRHISNIFDKLAVSSRTQAVARARSLGMLTE